MSGCESKYKYRYMLGDFYYLYVIKAFRKHIISFTIENKFAQIHTFQPKKPSFDSILNCI